MQRRRLLFAICEVVGEDGLESASVGAICKRAGVSRRTFYELFDDREACLLAAFEQTVGWLAASVLPAFESERRWCARVRAGLTALLELFDSAPGLARLCIVETLRVGAEVSEYRKRLLDVLVVVVDGGRSESRSNSAISPVAAQGVVGGALAVVHARLLAAGDDATHPLVELVNPLMGMIVHPYLGAAATRRELDRATATAPGPATSVVTDPFKDVPIRFTYRTARVLATIATEPGASNRLIAGTAGIADDGQISRLLTRLQRVGLVHNGGEGQPRGEPNAWKLTERGEAIHAALGARPN